jgi:cell division protein ZapE
MRIENPLPQYLKAFAHRGLVPDPAQTQALEALARVHQSLVKAHIQTSGHKIKHHFNKLFGLKQHPVQGFYFWGGVGRGKTLLMDIFFDNIPFKAKQRLHFHVFMRHIHHELKRLEGLKNPLSTISKEIAKQTHIICFDEFFVDDVADAMILADLLQHLFHEGVTMVFTSNTEPDLLYKNGVQRHRFIPAIDLIKHHTTVMQIDQGVDYRSQSLIQSGVYFTPLNPDTQHRIEKEFLQLATGDVSYGHSVHIMDREIETIALAHSLVWFDFDKICVNYRSAQDYLELSEQFDTFIITQIPVMNEADNAAVKRFIHLIDVLYDQHCKLIISAQNLPQQLYQGMALSKEFQRTVSRLLEMQSHEYLQSF